MKKKLYVLALASSLALHSLSGLTVYADAQKVVTLGADLTEEQKNAILKYFGILGDTSVQTITITNQDERDHLASFVPIEQIGTRTFSCALVKPTSSGGIQVKTANLNWVTGNMIASNLSTAGVKNCEVLAASPFEVSGTGALTGVLMAYETATGETLDEDKKELATQELVTTGEIADTVGQTTATQIVNDIKIQVIEGQVVDRAEVEEIVYDVIEYSDVEDEIDEDIFNSLTDLAEQISQMQYEYEDMKDTLERVAENTGSTTITINNANNNTNSNDSSAQSSSDTSTSVSNDSSAVSTSDTDVDNASSSDSSASADSDSSAESNDADSILNNTDVSALGGDVIVTDTLEPETEAPEQNADTAESEDFGFDITSSDEYSGGEQIQSDEDISAAEGSGESDESESAGSDAAVTDETGITFNESDAVTFQTDEGSEGSDSEVYSDDGSAEVTDAGADTQEDYEEDGVNEVHDVDLNAEDPDTFGDDSGALVFAQDGEVILNAGLGLVSVSVPQADLQLTTGTLTVTDSFGNEVVSLDVEEDAEQMTAQRTTERLLTEYGWTEGTTFYFHTGDAYDQDEEYTVTLSAFAASANDPSTAGQLTVEGTDSSDYSEPGITITLNDIDNLKTGSIVNAYYQFTEEYTAAEVTYFDSEYLTVDYVDSGFNLNLLRSGETTFTVTFYTEEGNVQDVDVELIIFA